MPSMYALRSAASSSSTPKANFPSHPRGTALPPPVPTPVPSAPRAIHAFNPDVYPSRYASNAVASIRHKVLLQQVNDPATEALMARVRLHDSSGLNYSSSGSPHDPSTVCLAAMVHEFLEEEAKIASCGRARCNCVDGVCADDVEAGANSDGAEDQPQLPDEHVCEILEGLTSYANNPELLLVVDIARAVEAVAEEMDADGAREHLASDRLRRSVMQRLRQEGYNAAICKSRWKHGDGLPGGDYEYIDIVMESKTGAKKHDRFIVDIDFRAQFEIARASKQYGQLLDVLPKLFVGRPERLKQVLKIMTNAAKCSLKEQGLLLPPWRKQKYVYAKWFSSYRRTVNPESASSSHNLLDLGSKAPKILSLDFTKEMDLLFYMAQMRGARNGHRHSQCPGNDPRRGNLGTNNAPFIKTGFLTSSSDRLPSDFNECTTATCTDWQLPPLDETRNVSNSRGKVSGISTAFRHPASISKPPTVPRLTMVS